MERTIPIRSTIGITRTSLPSHPAGRWDHGPDLEVELISGQLESRSPESVLNGANLMAIGDGTAGNWELFQFEEAQLIAPNRYWLRGRLRGQLGSDALMPEAWPEGSWVVLMDGTPEQITLSPSQRRSDRHFRIGPALRPVEDPSFVYRVEAFDGNGLRPYAPVHLRAEPGTNGDLELSWIRRTRIDGDSWDLSDVPLGEDSEAYRVSLYDGASLVREVQVTTPAWTYSAADQLTDGASGVLRVEVAQLSARYGVGPAGQLVISL